MKIADFQMKIIGFHFKMKDNLSLFATRNIDTDDLLLYLNQLFCQIQKFIENLNLCSRIRIKCAKQKYVQCIK